MAMNCQGCSIEKKIVAFEALKIMGELEETAGSSDWGGNVVGLFSLLIQALDNMPAKPKPGAKEFHLSYIKKRLLHRLKVFKEINYNPEVTSLPIKSPVFIIGNPRTGSTLLHNLLGEDPLARSPLMWEMIYPASDLSKEDRIDAASEFIQESYKQSPLFPVMHTMNPIGSDECSQALDMDLCSVPLIISLPMYRDFFVSQPMSRKIEMYKFHKQLMQLLEFQTPKDGYEHWIFKSSVHTLNLKALREVYPDAKFIFLHRDPVDVVSSSLKYWEAMASWMYDDEYLLADRIHRGKRLANTYASMLNRCCDVFSEWKASGYEPIVAHCHYNDLKADPVNSIKSMYQQLGCRFTPEFQQILISKFESMETSHKKTPYSHSLYGYGVTEDEIREAYTPYLNTPQGSVYSKAI